MAKNKQPIDNVRVIFVVVIIALGLSTSVFYLDSVQKTNVINNQTQTILGLRGIVFEQNSTINNLNVKIDGLENNIVDLQTDVAKKASQISNLSRQLGQTELNLEVAKNEIEALTPTIKNYFAVGVKSDSTGVVIPMNVKISKGTGILSVNIKGVDLQSGATASIRTASEVASQLTGIDLSKKDITVSFVNEDKDLVVLDGPSAGAAVTVTMYAALENKNMDTDSMMTGTIEGSGNIGKVGGVSAKAEAAKRYGVSTFYVPDGETTSISGLDVVEVSNINEALELIIK